MKPIYAEGRIWLLSLLLCAFAVAFAFAFLDVPAVRFAYRFCCSGGSPAKGLGSAILLALETLTALGVIILRLAQGHVSPLGKALALACLCSVCAYAVNSGILKLVFGVPIPAEIMQGVPHAFHFWHGTPDSSFPSGHMVLAGAFAGTFMRLYRISILPLALLLLCGTLVLVLGGWHFVSDVIAGTFAGVTAGLLAGEAWLNHTK